MKEIEHLVCVIDEDPAVRNAIESLLLAEGLLVEIFASVRDFSTRKSATPPACLVMGVDFSNVEGIELHRELARTERRVPIIFLTADHDIPASAWDIEPGAVDFLRKPFDSEELLEAVREGLDSHTCAVDASAEHAAASMLGIMGTSARLRSVLKRVNIVAPTESTVLILGETGVGKELIARYIHECSRRKNRQLVRVSCGSIPNQLFESEFFGHSKGAFTGAIKDRAGRFETAHGGTLFLDEIGEIPINLQSKLLRALQEKQYERIGEDTTRSADARIVAATNRDLEREVKAGRFREDLYYRLNVFPVKVPPLRERLEDIPLLTRHFVDLATKELGCRRPRLTEAGVARLQDYDWPGNIRELRNVVERAVILARGSLLDFTIPGSELPSQVEPVEPQDAKGAESEFITECEWHRRERQNLLSVLNKTDWKIGGPGGAAELLGVKPTTLASRIKKMGLKPSRDVL